MDMSVSFSVECLQSTQIQDVLLHRLPPQRFIDAWI